jgi:hypothetical protein
MNKKERLEKFYIGHPEIRARDILFMKKIIRNRTPLPPKKERDPMVKAWAKILASKYPNVKGRERTRMMVRMRDNFTCLDCGDTRTPEQAKEQKKRLFDCHHLNGLCGKKKQILRQDIRSM